MVPPTGTPTEQGNLSQKRCDLKNVGFAGVHITVKGQSRSDSFLLSPYHWAKLFRGVVAIVAVPMRFAVIS